MISWQHRLEAAGFFFLMGFFRLLGRERASAFGGWLFRSIGPLVSRHKKADARMARVMPELSAEERRAALTQMWDNLGRVAGEYPHLGSFTIHGPTPDIEIHGRDVIDDLKARGQNGIFVSGHFANWELMPLVLTQYGFEGAEVYRAPNNPKVDQWITDMRTTHIMARQVPKGAAGARELVKCVRSGISLAILADQKMNDGIESPFFGIPAMSPAAPAMLSLRYKVPIIPAMFERVSGTKFAIHIDKPIDFDPTGDLHTDIAALTTKVNKVLEDGIRARPGQWLWLHNRWKDQPPPTPAD